MLNWLAITPRPPRAGISYVAMRVLVFAIALLFIVLIYSTKERALFIAPPIALIVGAATWYLLGDTPLDGRRRLWFAGTAALILVELTWSIGYWSTLPLVGGAALWLGLYVLSGVLEASATASLDRRIAMEYAAVAAIGLVLVLAISRPWSP
jgi:hypothetical protein